MLFLRAASWAAVLAAAGTGSSSAIAETQSENALQPAYLTINLNGHQHGDPVLVLRGANGDIYLSAPLVRSLRLNLPPSGAVEFDGVPFVPLKGVSGLRVAVEEGTQSLSITASSQLVETSTISLLPGESMPMTQSGRGGFLNYEVMMQRASRETVLNGFFELGVFGGGGFGTSTFVGNWGGHHRFTRLDTGWTIDNPDRLRSLRLGDSITRGGVGGSPVRFGGVKFGSNFSVRPGFITMPLPTIDGSAAVPSVIDIYVNNTLRDTREVLPGPFNIVDVPVITGHGDVQLVLRDLLGRETVISQSYYVVPQLLRQGLHDLSYEVGFLREGYASESFNYGTAIAAGTHRYGFTDRMTGELHVEATTDTQLAGVASTVLWPDVGLFEASLAGSHGPDGIGGLAGFSFERQTAYYSLGARTELTTEKFSNVGFHGGRKAPASTLQLFAGMPVSFGSVGASYLLREGREEPDAELLSANASMRLGGLGTLHLTARKSFRGKEETAAELFLNIPLGPRTSASAGILYHPQGTSLTADLQRNLPVGEGLGYRAYASLGATDRLHGRLSLQTTFGSYDTEVTWVEGRTGVRFVARGAIAMVDGDVFASRRLSQSFAVADVGDFEDVRVYADNQLVGRTNGNGRVVVSRLRPYEENVLRVELADLPMDTTVTGEEAVVRPYDRSGVTVAFGATRSRGALMNVVLEDGTALPAGSTARLAGSSEETVVAPGGEVYLTGLGAQNSAYASWEGQTCQFDFVFPETDDPQPRLGQITCIRKR